MASAERGDKALEAKDYPTAIAEFTNAIKSNPKGFKYYVKRSTAYQRSHPAQYENALNDAEIAVKIAVERQRRELIAESQMRRAMVLYGLERYGDADMVLKVVRQKNEKEKSLQVWENMVKKKLDALAEGDEKGRITASEIPAVSIPTQEQLKGANKKAEVDEGPPHINSGSTTSNGAAIQAPKPAAVMTAPSAIKHDWYQTTDKVTIEIKVKGVPKDQTTIEINDKSVSVSFPVAGSSTYDFSLDPLFSPIDADKSSSNITAYKIELTLKKQQPGQKWPSLEAGEGATPATAANLQAVQSAVAKQKDQAASKAPAYPTSSLKGPTDWEKIGDDEDDSKDDGPDDFFKHLFRNADPDTRKAMIKSYTESNGTALSTNWEDVSKAPVETSPPDGMVAKKWEG